MWLLWIGLALRPPRPKVLVSPRLAPDPRIHSYVRLAPDPGIHSHVRLASDPGIHSHERLALGLRILVHVRLAQGFRIRTLWHGGICTASLHMLECVPCDRSLHLPF